MMIFSFSNPPVKTKTGTVATVDELKRQLNIPIEFDDDNTILADYLAAAVETVENDTNSDILETVNVLTHTLALDYSAQPIHPLIHINQAPVSAVSKIEKYNAGTWSDIPATDYKIEIEFNRVVIQFNTSHTAEKVRFTFATGYADAARPKQLKQAVILKAADMYGSERSNYATTAIADIQTYARLISKHVRTYW